MSSLTPSKRPQNRNPKESNRKKFQKLESSVTQKPLTIPSSAVFRVLCPSSKVGSVIGADDNIISQIHLETGAKVRVDDAIPGCDERVIFIMGPEKKSSEEIKSDDKDPSSAKEQGGSSDHDENNANKEAVPNLEDLSSEKGTSAVQKALLLVFEKIFVGEEKMLGDGEDNNGSTTVTFRLIVLSSQVGCLLGKGGSVIKQIAAESGAQIRVLPRDKLPQCASSMDDVVQITGIGDNLKKAIKSVSDQILGNLPQDDAFPSNSSGPPSHAHSHHLPRSGGLRDSGEFHSSGPPLYPKFHDNFMPARMDGSDIITFQLLCPDEKVGGVIGKGGSVIKTLQRETGCDIKVIEGSSDGEERMIVVSGPVHPDDRISAVQDAILRVQHQIAKATPDSKEKTVTAKILVSSNQIGCLLGKGGSIIAEMRKVTGAYIRILGKDQIPKCAAENEEVVQINGELDVVQEAILQITTRLQHHFFRDAFPSINHPLNHPFSDRAPPLPHFMGRGELSPPGMFPKLGPSFRNYDSIGGLPPRGGFHPFDDHPPFMHDIRGPGVPHISERPWHPQSLLEGGPMGMLDYAGAPRTDISGFGGGIQQAVITNTTVEVVVPSSLIPSIYGEDGGCLRQIRQISDAKITISNPKPGAPETMIIISGTPEQTHAAQSLIQAFVMIENQSR